MTTKVAPDVTGTSGAVNDIPQESQSLRRAVGVWGSYTWGYADVGADVYVAWLASHIPILGLFVGPYVATSGATLLLISSNSGVFAASRITYSMARFDLLPRWFAKVHSKFRTPVRTLVVFSGIALVELWLAG